MLLAFIMGYFVIFPQKSCITYINIPVPRSHCTEYCFVYTYVCACYKYYIYRLNCDSTFFTFTYPFCFYDNYIDCCVLPLAMYWMINSYICVNRMKCL